MIFLIEYNQSEGRIVTIRNFDDSQLREAEDSRLEIELALNRNGIDHEVANGDDATFALVVLNQENHCLWLEITSLE